MNGMGDRYGGERDGYPGQPLARRKSGRGRLVVFAVLVLGLGTTALGWQQGWWGDGWLPKGRWNMDLIVADESPAPPLAPLAAPVDPLARRLAEDTDRIAALEARMAALSRSADAAAGNAGHAEAIMVAAAARRAVERGAPLGYLTAELRLRFGAKQGEAVERVIAASARPVTLAMLAADLEKLAPQLGAAPPAGGLDWLRRETADLFTLRRNDSLSPDPAARLGRARLYLAGNRVDMAIGEIDRLPGHAAARNWMARARAWQTAQTALETLESAAILAASPLANPAAAVQPPAPVAGKPVGVPTPPVASAVAPSGPAPVVPSP